MNAAPPAVVDGHQNDMLRVLAAHYVGDGFAVVASVLFALLLISAASTAITGMLGVLFPMARDGELPRSLGRLNRFGVPRWALVVAVATPVLVLAFESHVEGLAHLYAIGVVGAIALNCLASALSRRPEVGRVERGGLLLVAGVMAAIWLTVAWERPYAFGFAVGVVGLGLLLRGAFRTVRERVAPVHRVPFPAEAPRLLIASRGDTHVVDQGLERASELGAAVVVCLVREASFLFDRAEVDQPDPALDPEATALFEYARKAAQRRGIPMRTLYTISTAPMSVLADHAVTLGVDEIHVGGSRRSRLEKAIRGSPLHDLQQVLPPETKIVVHVARDE
jgi:nucleotide-binding universal stress UspA family protein